MCNIFLEKFLKEKQHQSPRRVLDFGGDEGQFIPDIDSIEARAVFEVSSVSSLEGVNRFRDWTQVRGFSPDMIMMCHVLEHVENARELVETAFSVLASGGLTYIEVPLDSPPRPPEL